MLMNVLSSNLNSLLLSSPNLQHEDQVLEIFKIMMMSLLTAN